MGTWATSVYRAYCYVAVTLKTIRRFEQHVWMYSVTWAACCVIFTIILCVSCTELREYLWCIWLLQWRNTFQRHLDNRLFDQFSRLFFWKHTHVLCWALVLSVGWIWEATWGKLRIGRIAAVQSSPTVSDVALSPFWFYSLFFGLSCCKEILFAVWMPQGLRNDKKNKLV